MSRLSIERSFTSVAAILAVGCSEPAPPTEPSWQMHVAPLLAANCVRCHSYPFRGEYVDETGMVMTSSLRLDAFDDAELADDRFATSAGKRARDIFQRTHDIGLLLGDPPMPPDRRLGDYELELLRNWYALSPDGTVGVRNGSRPDNVAPVLAVVEAERTPTSITFDYELSDADGDLVVGTVIGPRFKDPPDEEGMVDPDAVIGNVVAGRDRFVWNTTNVPPGEYAIFARLDDGADVDPDGAEDFVVVELGTYTLP